MADKVLHITGSGGQEFDIPSLLHFLLSSKQNIEITSPKNINFEPTKSIKFKPGDGSQVEFLADHTGDLTEVLLKALVAVDELGNDLSKEVPIRFKFNCTEAEYNTKGAADTNVFDVKFKTGLKESTSGEHYCQTKFKGRSFDIRCYEHGGIALQPCGTDNDGHENKIKFESSRVTDVTEAPQFHSDKEGGRGIEFGTFNTQHTSLYTGDYRFRRDAPIYAVTRGPLETTATGKVDYPTQADDTKDIIDDSSPITWGDLIAAVKYLKGQGVI